MGIKPFERFTNKKSLFKPKVVYTPIYYLWNFDGIYCQLHDDVEIALKKYFSTAVPMNSFKILNKVKISKVGQSKCDLSISIKKM